MPKLPAVRPRVVIQFLERNGFVLDHVSGSHFIFYHPVPDVARSYPGTIAICKKEPWPPYCGKQGSSEMIWSVFWKKSSTSTG
jgi:HicA toxin of bacterial toxin-antitoxin,